MLVRTALGHSNKAYDTKTLALAAGSGLKTGAGTSLLKSVLFHLELILVFMLHVPKYLNLEQVSVSDKVFPRLGGWANPRSRWWPLQICLEQAILFWITDIRNHRLSMSEQTLDPRQPGSVDMLEHGYRTLASGAG
jgi:hypothetical protein